MQKKEPVLQKSLQTQFQEYAKQSVQNICDTLQTSATNGLSVTPEAKARHTQYGPNALTGHEATLWQILWNQIKSPFIYLLVIIAILNFILGDMLDGLMILTIVIINTPLASIKNFAPIMHCNFSKNILLIKFA